MDYFVIGNMYRAERSFGVYNMPYQTDLDFEDKNKNRHETGQICDSDICQLIERQECEETLESIENKLYHFRIQSGMKLGWVSFYTMEAARNHFRAVFR